MATEKEVPEAEEKELPTPAQMLDSLDAETILGYLNKNSADAMVEFVVDEHRERVLKDIGKTEAMAFFGLVDPAAEAEEKKAV